jgi:hypothetical protein
LIVRFADSDREKQQKKMLQQVQFQQQLMFSAMPVMRPPMMHGFPGHGMDMQAAMSGVQQFTGTS